MSHVVFHYFRVQNQVNRVTVHLKTIMRLHRGLAVLE